MTRSEAYLEIARNLAKEAATGYDALTMHGFYRNGASEVESALDAAVEAITYFRSCAEMAARLENK